MDLFLMLLEHLGDVRSRTPPLTRLTTLNVIQKVLLPFNSIDTGKSPQIHRI
jgi:hypothetical protein